MRTNEQRARRELEGAPMAGRKLTWRDAWLFLLFCVVVFAVFGWIG